MQLRGILGGAGSARVGDKPVSCTYRHLLQTTQPPAPALISHVLLAHRGGQSMGRASSAADAHSLNRLSHPGLSLAPPRLSHPWLSPGCLQQARKHTCSPGAGTSCLLLAILTSIFGCKFSPVVNRQKIWSYSLLSVSLPHLLRGMEFGATSYFYSIHR